MIVRCLLIAALSLVPPALLSAEVVQHLQPWTVQFDTDWCPRPDEVAEMSKYMSLWKNGCCVQSAILTPEARAQPDVLVPWRERITTANNFGRKCTGSVLSEQQQVAYDEAKKADARAAIARSLEESRLQQESLRRDAPAFLRRLPKFEFCSAFGSAIRELRVEGIGILSDLPAMVKTEATRRNMKFSASAVADGTLRIGMSECDLFASLGSPDQQNRTVTARSINIQYVYRSSRTYVYTENGQVTSWQD